MSWNILPVLLAQFYPSFSRNIRSFVGMNAEARLLLSAGTNLGDKQANLEEALGLLVTNGFAIEACSSFYETPPWGFESDSPFYNICFIARTTKLPTASINLLMEVEQKLGRERNVSDRYASRKIDLDIILWDNLLIHSTILEVPHPRAHLRRFVLEPAVEIAAEWVHPQFDKSLAVLLQECADDAVISKLNLPKLF